jgi:hypothetical protein
VPAPTENGEEALKAQDAGWRMLYELAAHGRAVLLDILASECRLESVNVPTGEPVRISAEGEGSRRIDERRRRAA